MDWTIELSHNGQSFPYRVQIESLASLHFLLSNFAFRNIESSYEKNMLRIERRNKNGITLRSSLRKGRVKDSKVTLIRHSKWNLWPQG
jgi:hypothetical protein